MLDVCTEHKYLCGDVKDFSVFTNKIFSSSHQEIVNKIITLEESRKKENRGKGRSFLEADRLVEHNGNEDRVFLRPSAIHSPQNNLNKRTSVDFSKFKPELRNMKSRSMSLPLTYSDLDFDDSLTDQNSSVNYFQVVSPSVTRSLSSPPRKLDFAFCKYSDSEKFVERRPTLLIPHW